MRMLLTFLVLSSVILAQFGKVEISVDDRLLRDSERQKISSIRDEINRFFSGRIWDEKFESLKILPFVNVLSHRCLGIEGY